MEDERTESENPGGDVEVREDERKPLKRRWVGVDIKLSDAHYIAKFNHGDPRVFHNMPELLTAIEVECEKLK